VSDETSTTGPGGRYELLELLEEGICGKLYRARDAREDRPVLVKLITRSVSKDPEFRRYAYDRWAERDALFEHPNIVTIVEVGKSGEQYFLAVEEPEGERLCERMKEAPLDTDEVVEILRQIAEALRAAHRRQVVHGYLKPSDVFLTRDPSGRLLVKVLFLDLGTSAAESVLPMFGEVHGSPKYMAPEVIRGATPGVQSDVFALGVIGYELLTGREPFAAEHPIGYLFANCETPLVPPHLVNEKVPREVSLVVSRCLEKDPERRYRSAQRVIDDLERCEEVTKTGKVSIVPRGSDSAFAREYELPELEKREKAPARTSATSLVALVLALAALGVTIVWNYTSLLRPGAEERQEHPVGITPPERPGRHGEQPPREAGPTQQAREAAARAQRARSAYEAARKDWTQRLSLRGAYELGVAKFEEIAADYAGTPAAEQARQAAAEVYCEWAEVLAEKGDLKDLEEAEAKYRRAMQMAPESEPLRQVFELKVPPVMAQRAAALEGLRRYAEALALYRDIRKEFPGSVAAALLPRKEPGLLLKYGYDLWQQDGELEKAIAQFRAILKDHPDSDEAEEANGYLPRIYYDIARAKVERGDLEDAREDLAELKAAYPDTPVGQQAAELDAEILFRLYEAAERNNQADAATRYFIALATEHPASVPAQVACRRRLGLEAPAGEVLFDSATARSKYRDAEQYRDQMRYEAALNMLRAVIRYTAPDSEVGRQALQKLPEWMYEAGLDAVGRGAPEEASEKLEELRRLLPQTQWADRAQRTLQRLSNPPEGMVYVPEGPFQMGASEEEILRFLRPFYGAEILGSGRELDLILSYIGYVSEMPKHTASTGAYYIDKTEVSNAQYKQFVDETGYGPPAHWTEGTYGEGEADLPVTNVSLEDAAAYAKWAGKRLPTEAEWEKAARGTDGRFYPWGAVFDRNSCQHMRESDAGPVAVGSYLGGASPYGALDMLGNVWEWTTSAFEPYPGNERTDARAPYGETHVVLRGGAWDQHDIKPVPIRVSFRFPEKPYTKARDIGFRCVKDAQ